MKDDTERREVLLDSSGHEVSESQAFSQALELGRMGINVFAIHGMEGRRCTCGGRGKNCRPGKHPQRRNPFKDATTDESRIRKQWEENPCANSAIPHGKQFGLFALDVDIDKGGPKSLKRIEEEYGRLPETWTVRTGPGGKHYYYLYPENQTIRNSAGKLGPGLDIRGEGGFTVGPGSKHQNGELYVSESSPSSIAKAPEYLLKLIRETSAQKRTETGASSEELMYFDELIQQGIRNDTLFRKYACFLKNRFPQKLVTEWCLLLNAQRCDPPLPTKEVLEIVASAFRRPKRKCRNVGPSPGAQKVHSFIKEQAGGAGWWEGTVEQISAKAGVSSRHVKRCVRQLELFDLLEVQGDLGKSNRYILKNSSSVVFYHRGDRGVTSVQLGVRGDMYKEKKALSQSDQGPPSFLKAKTEHVKKEFEMSENLIGQERRQASHTDPGYQVSTKEDSRYDSPISTEMPISGSRDPKSDVDKGRLGGLIVEKLRQGLENEHSISSMPAVIKDIILGRKWTGFMDCKGNTSRFDSFNQFVGQYLNTSVQSLKELFQALPDVRSLIDSADAYPEVPTRTSDAELFERYLLMKQLGKALRWRSRIKHKFPRWIAYVIENETWRGFTDPTSGGRCEFKTFREFVESHCFGGLRSSVKKLKLYCASSDVGTRLIETVITADTKGAARARPEGQVVSEISELTGPGKTANPAASLRVSEDSDASALEPSGAPEDFSAAAFEKCASCRLGRQVSARRAAAFCTNVQVAKNRSHPESTAPWKLDPMKWGRMGSYLTRFEVQVRVAEVAPHLGRHSQGNLGYGPAEAAQTFSSKLFGIARYAQSRRPAPVEAKVRGP